MILDLHRIATLIDDADPRPRHLPGVEHADEAGLLGARHGHQDPAGGLGEQPHERIGILGKQYAATGFAGECGFDDGLDQTTLADVVGCRDEPVTRTGHQDLPDQPFPLEVHLRRHPAEMIVGDLCPDRAVEFVAGLAEQDERLARLGADSGRDAPADVVDDPEYPHHRRRQDGRRTGLVVEADVAAGDRDAQLCAAVGQTAYGLLELPHHGGVLRGPEVEAVGHGLGRRAGDGDVAVRLGERELRTAIGIEEGVAARRIRRESDAAAGLLVDPDHPGIGILGEHRVAAHVPVVLLGDELAATQSRRRQQPQQRLPQFVGRGRPFERFGGRRDHRVLPVGASDGTLVDRAFEGDGARRRIDDRLPVPGDDEMVTVGDLADDGREHIPLAADLEKLLDVVRGDHRTHPLLRLAGEHLGRGHPDRAHRHLLQVDMHATITRGSQFRCGTGQSSTTEILDTHHQPGVIELEATLDEHLLGKRIAHLHTRQLLTIGPG